MSDSPNDNPDIPTFAELAADPEIAALLDFEPVPRQIMRPDGWTPDRQREFIAYLAWFGLPKPASDAMGKNVSGVTALYKQKGADSFRASWDGAIALWQSRQPPDTGTAFLGRVPGMGLRLKENRPPPAIGPLDVRGQPALPGQVMNEYGEWEDEESYLARAEDARQSICSKLLNARRLYLRDISASPGKRAAFEILTELPVDWDKAARLQPQDFEPWTRTNQRQPDMILTAESGWSAGEIGYGPNRMAAARQAIDEYRASEGLPPVDWSESTESNDTGA
ncbi:MAG TPA: hypothetical protein VM308_00480 [Sphingomicrobium sp.]|nr:hypothetical protein [Sphingomicrobium sp.]